jgi:hypothetical protein
VLGSIVLGVIASVREIIKFIAVSSRDTFELVTTGASDVLEPGTAEVDDVFKLVAGSDDCFKLVTPYHGKYSFPKPPVRGLGPPLPPCLYIGAFEIRGTPLT